MTQQLRRVVIVSDCTDLAFAEMRGNIYRAASQRDPQAKFEIEPLVPVHALSVLNAGFALRMMADAYGTDCLFMFIMNSLRERTERIVGRTASGHTFEGTNTGAVGWLLEDFDLDEVWEVKDPGFVPFGGKHVHSPAVGNLMAGAELQDIADPFDPARVRRTVPTDSQVVHVDNFGNAKFRLAEVPPVGSRVKVTFPDGKTIDAVSGRRMMEHNDGTWVVYPGSSLDLYELGEVRGSGLQRYDLSPGDFLRFVAVN